MKYWPQIQSLSNQLNLLTELRLQIAKDLSLDVDLIPEKELESWLSQWIEIQGNHLDWLQLLYRIDLEFKSAESTWSLANRILEREAQKVIFRAQYSGRI